MTAVNLSFPKKEEKFSFEFGRQDCFQRRRRRYRTFPKKAVSSQDRRGY
jgi:hypothetical protein